MLKPDWKIGDPMRTPIPAVLLATAMLIPISAQAKDKPSPAPSVPAQTYTPEESARMGAEVQRRAEARQREWDRKTKALSGSICHGC